MDDLIAGLKLWPYYCRLGYDDISQRYVRTALGPFWMIITSGVWIFMMALVSAGLFKQRLVDAFPFVATGMYAWIFMNTCFAEATHAILGQSWLLTAAALPRSFHIWRTVVRMTIIILHYVPVLLAILVFCQKWPTVHYLVLIPSLVCFIWLGLWLSLLLGPLALRFRDLPHVVTTLCAAVPLLSPIVWPKEALNGYSWIADVNPVFHFIELIRAPLLGAWPTAANWGIVTVVNIVGLICGYATFVSTKSRLALWA